MFLLFLSRIGKKEVERLRDFKCPFSGQSLSVKTLKEERETRKKYAGYHSEWVFKKTDEHTIRGGLVNTRLYDDQQIGGILQERLYDFNLDYSLIFTQTTQIETRKNRYAESVDDINKEYIKEVYTYEVESFGKLGRRDRIRLKKICKKACFIGTYEA